MREVFGRIKKEKNIEVVWLVILVNMIAFTKSVQVSFAVAKAILFFPTLMVVLSSTHSGFDFSVESWTTVHSTVTRRRHPVWLYFFLSFFLIIKIDFYELYHIEINGKKKFIPKKLK